MLRIYNRNGGKLMHAIPSIIEDQFEVYLKSKAIPVQFHGPYKKWSRYYLDFCQEYNFLL